MIIPYLFPKRLEVAWTTAYGGLFLECLKTCTLFAQGPRAVRKDVRVFVVRETCLIMKQRRAEILCGEGGELQACRDDSRTGSPYPYLRRGLVTCIDRLCLTDRGERCICILFPV